MTQLAANSRSEAEALHAVVVAFARPHIDAAALVALQASRGLAEILEHIPAGLPERVHIEELRITTERYAALLGLTPDAPPADAAPTLGLARRTAIEAINQRADALVDGAVLAWGRSLDLPVMDVRRLVDAATIAMSAIAAKRARGELLSVDEAGQELGLQALHARTAEIRSFQRDHVRAIDAMEDVDAVARYPDAAIWPA